MLDDEELRSVDPFSSDDEGPDYTNHFSNLPLVSANDIDDEGRYVLTTDGPLDNPGGSF